MSKGTLAVVQALDGHVVSLRFLARQGDQVSLASAGVGASA